MTGEVRKPSAGDQPADGGVKVDEGAGASGGEQHGEVAALQGQLDERTADLQRISAEYTNYRRRVERDRQAVITAAKAQVAGELLTVLDDIERAEAHGDLSGAFKAVADKVVAGLQTHGLEAFGAEGDTFDPDVHEAVQHSTSPEVSEPTVTTVLRRGYRLGERVLRPAMVAVTDAETAGGDAAGVGGAGGPSEGESRDAARFSGAGTADGASGAAGSPGPGGPGGTEPAPED